MRPTGSRFCNEPGCNQRATHGFSKCEPHGLAAQQRNLADKERWAQEDRQRAESELETLAKLFNVDTSAIEALVEYVKEKT
ncbi:hypothetical protein X766_16065 [Mesorhizobium sp. LSJC255A00]|nr:hypothetical protein X766_16065 [Mesorhizobium sp. LSJC255A00]